MGDILDNKPPFTIVMGCNGCGKTTWKRANRDALAEVHIDLDSIADGVGNWDSEASRIEAFTVGEALIQRCLSERQPYGVESTYSGERGVNQVNEAKTHGFRIHGHYLGTYSPQINIDRIEQRVQARTGHRVNPELIPTRWRYSLSNLRKTIELFNELTIYDNSADYDLGCQDPPRLAFFQNGLSTLLVKKSQSPEWFKTWYTGWEQRQTESKRQDRRREKAKRFTSTKPSCS